MKEGFNGRLELYALGRVDLAVEELIDMVGVAADDNTILAGVLHHVGVHVHCLLLAQKGGDEAEDSHKEAAGQEHYEADCHLLPSRLLVLHVVLPDEPPHEALVVGHLLLLQGGGLLAG